MKRLVMIVCFAVGSISIFAACANDSPDPKMKENNLQSEDAVETSSEKPKKVEVPLKDKDDVEIGGVIFQEADNGVQVNVQVTHLEEGSYGIHIHDKGVCEPPSFESAGDHFNPDDRKHGFYNQEGPHKGDMENLKVDEDGEADQMYMNEFVTLKKGEPNSLITKEGTSVIIHEEEDDYMTQPAGDAGDRIYCGVISPPEK